MAKLVLYVGFTDQRIIDAIDDYQWKIDNALGQWALDSMYTTLTDGRKAYGSYCKFVDHLKNVGVLKHVPDNVTKYQKAEKKFKEYKLGGKFMVKDIIAGAKSFDTISTVSNLIFDADGLTDIIALLEREGICA